MIDPELKHQIFVDAQEDLIANLGKPEFLRQLNAIIQAIYKCVSTEFPDAKIAIVAMALDSMSSRMIEKAQAISKQGTN